MPDPPSIHSPRNQATRHLAPQYRHLDRRWNAFRSGSPSRIRSVLHRTERIRQRGVQTLQPLTPHTDKSGSNVDVQAQLRPLPAHGNIPRTLIPTPPREASASLGGVLLREFIFFSIIGSKYQNLLLTLRSQTASQTTPVG